MWAKLKYSCLAIQDLGPDQPPGSREGRAGGVWEAPDKSDFLFLVAAATGMQWEQPSVRERGYCVCVP